MKKSYKAYYDLLGLTKVGWSLLSKPAKASLVEKHYREKCAEVKTSDQQAMQIQSLNKARNILLRQIYQSKTAEFVAKHLWISLPPQYSTKPVELTGQSLNIDNIVNIACFNAKTFLTTDKAVLKKITASETLVNDLFSSGTPMYGVSTNFGGLSHLAVDHEKAINLQHNLFNFLKAGSGTTISAVDVRASMVLRANSLMKGASGVRIVIIERLIDVLNHQLTPLVHQFGSIGASGDLIPLAAIGGAILGLNDSFKFEYQGQTIPALEGLAKFNLPQLTLSPKEGLAIVNGSSVSTGIAANCIYHSKLLLNLTMGAHALFLQALNASNQPFDDFIHLLKPYPGQIWAARNMQFLLANSKLIRDEINTTIKPQTGELIQDPYSIRCLAQYVSNIAISFEQIAEVIETEANSATDNPLLDVKRKMSLHGGNFLSEQVAIALDQLRFSLGMLAKHVDVQVALLMLPVFSHGLPPSLIGNKELTINAGLKGLQLCMNSMSPLMNYLGNALSPLYPTYAEQFNQNVNSQSFESALLTRWIIDIYQQFLAIALIVGIQAVALRSYQQFKTYDPRAYLSPATTQLYELIFDILDKKISAKQPYIFNDDEQSFERDIACLTEDIKQFGKLTRWRFEI